MSQTNYYFTDNPEAESNPVKWDFTLLNHNLIFNSDNGVFSKTTVDYGSRVLIDNINYDLIPEGAILDLGTGYGPIGLAIAKAYPQRELVMVDVNMRALGLAKQNAVDNQIKNVRIFQSNVYENIDQQFAAIITNPPVRAGKNVVDEMIAKAKDHLVANGTLTVVLQKKQGAPSAKKLMQATFGNCEIIKRDKGYYILQSINE